MICIKFDHRLLSLIVPPKRKCCLALTAECLACQAGLSVEVFCNDKPMTTGCPRGIT